ncbi:MAG: nucleoside 2-deoxyribosyltransferase [Snowella sp.]|nr:nucleoside 2-deoxyribosyltransferase [Snowella sp.]
MSETELIQIYLAAPLFSKAEQDFNAQLGQALQEKGYQVFLPQKECNGKQGEAIYHTCLNGLRAAKVVVAILDGADADSGTCWEFGYAVGQGIPAIAVRTDFRVSGDTQGFNAMLYYSAAKVVDSPDDYLEKILNALQSLGF